MKKYKPRQITEKQFNNWSRPSQYIYSLYQKSKKWGWVPKVSLALALCMLVYNIFIHEKLTNYFESNNKEKIEQKLEKYVKDKDWYALRGTLYQLGQTYKHENWFKYYSGINATKVNRAINSVASPEQYFMSIETNDFFFGEGLIQLVAYYLKNNKPKLANTKIKKLIKQLDEINYKNPEYYLLHLSSFQIENDKEKLLQKYLELKEVYPTTFETPSGSLVNKVSSTLITSEINMDKLSKTCGIAFAIMYKLINLNIGTELVLKDARKMFPSINSYMFAEMGMSRLNIELKIKHKKIFKNFVLSL